LILKVFRGNLKGTSLLLSGKMTKAEIYPKGGFILVKPYETLFFTEPGIENEALDALIGKVENAITKNGGQVEKIDKWGRRPLAYPVEKHTEGNYVLINFQATGEALKELERTYLINQTILRFMTTVRGQ
jgi:small subunit ribosomal protein S6